MIIYDFKEYGGNQNQSIKEYFNDKPYPEKEAVLKFLKTAGTPKCSCGIVKDVIDGSLHGTSQLFRHGEYSWITDITYHVEKYNFRPNDDFICYVLKQTERSKP